jgi:hypothetical protein
VKKVRIHKGKSKPSERPRELAAPSLVKPASPAVPTQDLGSGKGPQQP